MGEASGRGPIAQNRRARHDYEILDTYEAGIALLGPEVKSLREGKASLADAWASVRRGEVFVHSLHISPYAQAGRENPEPRRDRKLLLHRIEIQRLAAKVNEQGLTLVPLSLYFKEGRVKVELGLVKGRRRHDKRDAIQRREQDREVQRELSNQRRRGS